MCRSVVVDVVVVDDIGGHVKGVKKEYDEKGALYTERYGERVLLHGYDMSSMNMRVVYSRETSRPNSLALIQSTVTRTRLRAVRMVSINLSP